MNRETSELLRAIYPMSLQWRIVRTIEAVNNMFFWWVK